MTIMSHRDLDLTNSDPESASLQDSEAPARGTSTTRSGGSSDRACHVCLVCHVAYAIS